jgi:hypothetical protein
MNRITLLAAVIGLYQFSEVLTHLGITARAHSTQATI